MRASEIEDQMRNRLTSTVAVQTVVGERIVGTYEEVVDGAAVIEVNPVTEDIRRVPCGEIETFALVEAPIDHTTELR